MELTKVDGQLIHLLQQRKNLSSIELVNGFLSIAKDQSDFSGFPVNNFIESLVKCSISKLKRKPEQFQDVFITKEEINDFSPKVKRKSSKTRAKKPQLKKSFAKASSRLASLLPRGISSPNNSNN